MRLLAAGVFAAMLLLSGCSSERAESIPNGANPPGAGGGHRGGANDGTAAGSTGQSNEAGGKFDNGPTRGAKEADKKRTEKR